MVDPGPRSKKPAMFALVALVALVATAAVVGVLVTWDGGDGTDWNAIVTVDRESSELVLYDDAGEEVDRLDPGIDDALFATPRGSYVLVTDGAGSAAAIVDATDGEVIWESAVEDLPRWVDGTRAPVVTIGPPEGGELRIVDAASGTDVELAEEAGITDPLFTPQVVAVSPDGTLFAATGSGEDGVTAIVDLEAGEVRTTPGRLVAIADDQVVVLDAADDGGAARFVGRDGEETGSAPMPQLPRTLALTDTSALSGVGQDGDRAIVFEVAAGDDEPTVLDEVGLSEIRWARAFPDRDRLVVTGGDRTVVLDTSGEEVASFEGELAPMQGLVTDAAACVVVVDGEGLTLVDLDSGEKVATAEGASPASALLQSSADGCAVAQFPGAVLTADGPVEVEDNAVVTIAADGEAALERGRDQVRLIDLTDPDEEPLELDGLGGGFVER